MIVVMEPDAAPSQIEAVIGRLVAAGFDVHQSSGQTRTILGVVGDVTGDDVAVVREMEGVAEVVRVSDPYRLASRRFRTSPTVVEGDFGSIGGGRPWIAIEPIGLVKSEDDGPPSAEIRYDVAAGRPFDAAVVRQPVAPESVGALACLSLHAHPRSSRWPVVFVTRQPTWGPDRWIAAAERELTRSGHNVVLLEAGLEYPSGLRTLEIGSIPRAKAKTHLPIVVDVPTIAQRAKLSQPVAAAAIAAGADGVVLRAWVGREGESSRVPATLSWSQAVALAEQLRAVGAALAP